MGKYSRCSEVDADNHEVVEIGIFPFLHSAYQRPQRPTLFLRSGTLPKEAFVGGTLPQRHLVRLRKKLWLDSGRFERATMPCYGDVEREGILNDCDRKRYKPHAEGRVGGPRNISAQLVLMLYYLQPGWRQSLAFIFSWFNRWFPE